MLLLGLCAINPAMVEHLLDQGCVPRRLIAEHKLQPKMLRSDNRKWHYDGRATKGDWIPS